MIWLAAAAAIALAAVVIWQLGRWLTPRPDSDRRRCPHCGHEFDGERRYCIACGGQIWDDVLSDI